MLTERKTDKHCDVCAKLILTLTAPFDDDRLTVLGRIYVARNQAPRARECFGRALDLSRRLGQTTEQIDLLTALASLAAETNQTGNAITLCEQALHIASVTGG